MEMGEGIVKYWEGTNNWIWLLLGCKECGKGMKLLSDRIGLRTVTFTYSISLSPQHLCTSVWSVWKCLSFFYSSVLVCLECHNKIPKTWWFKQQKYFFSQFCRLEVQDQVLSQSSSWLDCLLGLHMATFLLCLQMVERDGKISPSYKATVLLN